MSTMTETQDKAKEAAEWFTTKQRDNGDTFYTLKDYAPNRIKDLVHKAHGDDFLPDDWRYKWTLEALEFIAESDNPEDGAGEFADQSVSVYTGERFAWLSSNLQRAGYCDEAIGELGSSSMGIVDRVGLGQYVEATEVYELVLQALTES